MTGKQRQQIIEFIKTQEKELKSNDLIYVYRHCKPTLAPLLTEFFITNGIDPLKYMDMVPYGYAADLDVLMSTKNPYRNKIVIPDNIDMIDMYAFYKSFAKELYIPSSMGLIRPHAFAKTDIETITIDGKPHLLEKSFNNNLFLKKVIINCSEDEWNRENSFGTRYFTDESDPEIIFLK